MVYKFQCSLDKQDCAKLYNPRDWGPIYKLPFTSQSCVRDARLEGNIGRCGFPGAPCRVDADGNDNCAGGGDHNTNSNNNLQSRSRSVCREGICRGEAGFPCRTGFDCNWGMGCNSTSVGTCGGQNSYMANVEVDNGLDFGRDYCLSGLAHQDSQRRWLCSPGPPMKLTVAPPRSKKASAGLIAGVTVGGCVLLLALLACCLWWRRKRKRQVNTEETNSNNSQPTSAIQKQDYPMEPEDKTDVNPAVVVSRKPPPPQVSSFLPEIQNEQYTKKALAPVRHASWASKPTTPPSQAPSQHLYPTSVGQTQTSEPSPRAPQRSASTSSPAANAMYGSWSTSIPLSQPAAIVPRPTTGSGIVGMGSGQSM